MVFSMFFYLNVKGIDKPFQVHRGVGLIDYCGKNYVTYSLSSSSLLDRRPLPKLKAFVILSLTVLLQAYIHRVLPQKDPTYFHYHRANPFLLIAMKCPFMTPKAKLRRGRLGADFSLCYTILLAVNVKSEKLLPFPHEHDWEITKTLSLYNIH